MFIPASARPLPFLFVQQTRCHHEPVTEPPPFAVDDAPETSPADSGWAQLAIDLADAAAEGTHQAWAVGLQAACDLVPASGAALMRWHDGSGEVLAALGSPAPEFPRRPAEGPGWKSWTPIASVSLDPRHDLVVSRTDGPSFRDGDVRTLRALAALLRLAGSGTGTVRHVLQGFATRVVSSLSVDDVFLSSAEAVSQLLTAEIAGVLTPSPDGRLLEMRCVVGNTELATARLALAPGEGLAGRVWRSGRPERVDDYGTDPRSAPALWALSDIEGTCSAQAVPMRRDGKVIGVVVAWRRRRAPFNDSDEALLQSLADISAAAVHNATVHGALSARAEVLDADYRRLIERERQMVRTLEIQSDLARIATEGHDLAAVVHAVGSRIGGGAAVTTDDGRVVAWEGGSLGWDLRARLRTWIASHPPAVPPGDVVTVEGSPGWMLVAPLRAVGMTFGHLALGLSAAPRPEDELAAQQAAVASALLIAREEATLTASRRAQSEFVWDLLAGRLPDDVEAAVRARHLGTGFRLPARVVAVETIGTPSELPPTGSEDQRERARGRLARLVISHLEGKGLRHAVLASRADLFAVIVPLRDTDPDAELRTLAAALDGIVWPTGVHAVVGIGGRVEHVRGLQHGWREAQLARSAARAGAAAAFEDLGVLQFLLAPTTREELEGFARRRVGPLLDYDKEHSTELVPTLVAYFAAECSTRQAAERMFVHHRTVSYRLHRVEELTGMRMNAQEDRLEVQLALKILALGTAGSTDRPSA
jgi:sugar diacid utilization regulator/GAF domain-containing protein